MSEPQLHVPHLQSDRRHPHISHQELRRQLIVADEERYRLRLELSARDQPPHGAAAQWWRPRHATTIGVGTTVAVALAGGLAWQMCRSTARADDRSTVRVATTTVVSPRIIAEAGGGQIGAKRAVPTAWRAHTPRRVATVRPSVRTTPHVQRATHRRAVPRPLSPGEFGRKSVAAP